MPDLNFQVDGVVAPPFAALPQLAFTLHVANTDAEEWIHSVVLRCQIQIAAPRRLYQATEQERLLDLFGQPERWSQTLRPMLWTHSSVVVPPFKGRTHVDMLVPCSFDFNVAATKYFYALESGEIPLLFLFSGTIFYESEDLSLQVAQISWDKEAPFRLPVEVWKKMIDYYYPNSAWLALHKDVFDRLYRYKMRHGLPTWEQALERLLAPDEEQEQL